MANTRPHRPLKHSGPPKALYKLFYKAGDPIKVEDRLLYHIPVSSVKNNNNKLIYLDRRNLDHYSNKGTIMMGDTSTIDKDEHKETTS